MQPGQNQTRDDRPVLVVLGPGPAETHWLVSTHHGHQHEVIHVWDVPCVLLDKEDRGGRHGPPNGPGEDPSRRCTVAMRSAGPAAGIRRVPFPNRSTVYGQDLNRMTR